MKNILERATMLASIALLTGCGVGDLKESEPFNPSAVGNKNDKLSVTKINGGKGFLVFWTKKAGSYGEVIYTDSTSKSRGNGYPLTANYTGTYTMPCTMTSSNSSSASFSCKPSNVSFSRGVTLKTGVQYKWLVNYGFDHEKGEVEAIMEYHGDGTITVE